MHLGRIRDMLVEGVYLASLSQGVYSVLLVSFVVVTTNLEKIMTVLPWNPYLIVFLGTPTVFSGVILFGFVMDRYANFARTFATASNRRNRELSEILERVRRIEERLEKGIVG